MSVFQQREVPTFTARREMVNKVVSVQQAWPPESCRTPRIKAFQCTGNTFGRGRTSSVGGKSSSRSNCAQGGDASERHRLSAGLPDRALTICHPVPMSGRVTIDRRQMVRRLPPVCARGLSQVHSSYCLPTDPACRACTGSRPCCCLQETWPVRTQTRAR